MRKFVRFLTRSFFRILNRAAAEGVENIPPRGPLIVACNHVSNADPPALMGFIDIVRAPSVLAKKELFSFLPFGLFLKFMGAIPLERHKEGGDLSAFRSAIRILKEGGCLLIFPEGTRARGRKLNPKKGVAFLAHKTGAAVLPAAISGSENFSKLSKINIKFGRPEKFPPVSENIKEEYEKFSLSVMRKIESLKKEML